MADPRQNYLQQLRAYAQPTPVYTPADIPASVRTYSVFDPSSNTWRRMTNDGRSPIPVQGQAVVPVQAPVQTSSRGSRTPSPASRGGGAVLVQGQPSKASQRAVEAPVAVQAGNPAATVSIIPEIPEDASVHAPAELYQGAGKTPEGNIVHTSILDNPVLGMSPDYRIPRNNNKLTYADTQYLPDPDDEVISDNDPDFVRQDDLSYYPHASPEFKKYYALGLGAFAAPVVGAGVGSLAKPAVTTPFGLLRSVGGKVLGGTRTFGGKLGSSAIQRGKGLIDWAKTKVTRTKPNPSWQEPL